MRVERQGRWVGVTLAWLWLVVAAPAIEIYVSPRGDDANAGTKKAPLATVAGAQLKARAAGGRQTVTVHLAGGTYYFAEPLVFTPADSGSKKHPVTYEADAGQTVVWSGGTLLELKWEPYREGILKANVPAGFATDQLFINGERQHLARYPNYNPAGGFFNGSSADCLSPDRVQRWADPAGGYIHAMHAGLWGGFHYRITGKDATGKLSYEGGWQNNRSSPMHGSARFVENIFEELDSPGEWFHDNKTHTLFFYPPAGVDLATARVESVRLRHLVEFRGDAARPVREVHLRGISFRHAARTFMDTREPLLRSDWTIYRGGAVVFTGTEDCSLEDAVLDQVGGNAVFVNNYNRRVTIRGGYIREAGAGGVMFVGDPKAVRSPLFEYSQRQPLEKIDRQPGPQSENYPADCRVEDCLITRIGRFEKQATGVGMNMAARITVSHCSIYDVPRAGINIGDGCWGGHVIEFCDVFDTVKETGDHGSFNSWGRDRYWLPDIGEVSRLVAANPDLPRLDAREPVILRNSRWRCDHGWDIDLDDGSSNYLLYNNLCLNGGIKNREGYGRVVENNIMVGNSFHPHVWYHNSDDIFRRNIVCGPYQPIGVPQPWGKECDFNLLHQPGQGDTTPAKGLAQQSGRDAHSIEADALFINPAAGDYRVRPESPALQLGFRNFPMDQFGVQKPTLKAIARVPMLPGAGPKQEANASGRDNRTADWLGATLKNVVGLGEVSAAGLPGETGVRVQAVGAHSAAERAGLRAGDVILLLQGRPITSLEEFLKRDHASAPVRQLQLGIFRNQQNETLTVER